MELFSFFQPWMECDKFQEIQHSLEDPTSEKSKFKLTSHYKDVVSNVTQRLGLKTQMSHENISSMWNVCRYQQSYHLNKPSDWCAVLTEIRHGFEKIRTIR